MRVLEAHFHPQKKSGGALIVVGRVYCDGDRSWVAENATNDGAMVAKLRYLVSANGPRPYQKLLQLTSDFWSFVEVNDLEGGKS